MEITHTLVDDVLTLTPGNDAARAWMVANYFANLNDGSVRYALNIPLERDQARRFIRRAVEAGWDLGGLTV
jgi:hypothetical protein